MIDRNLPYRFLRGRPLNVLFECIKFSSISEILAPMRFTLISGHLFLPFRAIN